jgi:hypothetical protein
MMMETANLDRTDPYGIDPLGYLADLNGVLSPTEQREHYQVLKPSLLRVQKDSPAVFDLVLRETSKKLKIKPKSVREDLARLVDPPAAKEARELLEQMGQTRLLRIAQDFVDGKLWFGVNTSTDKLLVNSDRELLPLSRVPEELTVKDTGFDLSRFSKAGILSFLSGKTVTGAELLTDLRVFLTRFAIFRDTRIPLLLAVWTLGTYCHRIFRVFPYLALRSPDKRCGKSRVLDLLSLLAFNASPRVVHPTESQIFRGPSRNGGTLLLDEVEALGKADKDNYAGLLSVLNSGFERGGSVSRMAKDARGNFQEISFETFCPRAIAGINKTADTLEDRSIMITMQRKLAREQTERFSPLRLEEEAQVLRDRCYIWALTHAQDLAGVYDQADKMFSTLDSLDDRARDLWEPLVSMTAMADVERNDGQRTLTDEMITLAQDLCQVRDGAAEDSTIVLVLKALQAIFAQKRQEGLGQSQATILLAPEELAPLVKEKLGWEKLSTKGLAKLLNPLGFYAKHTRADTRGRRYHLSEEALKDLAGRYEEQTQEEENLTRDD